MTREKQLRGDQQRPGADEETARSNERRERARRRFEIGRQTLAALLDHATPRAAADTNDVAVGRVTHALTTLGPALSHAPDELHAAVRTFEQARDALSDPTRRLSDLAAAPEAAMQSLLARAGIPADMLPRDLVGDLRADEAEGAQLLDALRNPLGTLRNAAHDLQRRARSGATSLISRAFARGTAAPARNPDGIDKRAERPKLSDLAHTSGFLQRFRVPQFVTTSLTSRTADSEQEARANPAAGLQAELASTMQSARSSLTNLAPMNFLGALTGGTRAGDNADGAMSSVVGSLAPSVGAQNPLAAVAGMNLGVGADLDPRAMLEGAVGSMLDRQPTAMVNSVLGAMTGSDPLAAVQNLMGAIAGNDAASAASGDASAGNDAASTVNNVLGTANGALGAVRSGDARAMVQSVVGSLRGGEAITANIAEPLRRASNIVESASNALESVGGTATSVLGSMLGLGSSGRDGAFAQRAGAAIGELLGMGRATRNGDSGSDAATTNTNGASTTNTNGASTANDANGASTANDANGASTANDAMASDNGAAMNATGGAPTSATGSANSNALLSSLTTAAPAARTDRTIAILGGDTSALAQLGGSASALASNLQNALSELPGLGGLVRAFGPSMTEQLARLDFDREGESDDAALVDPTEFSDGAASSAMPTSTPHSAATPMAPARPNIPARPTSRVAMSSDALPQRGTAPLARPIAKSAATPAPTESALGPTAGASNATDGARGAGAEDSFDATPDSLGAATGNSLDATAPAGTSVDSVSTQRAGSQPGASTPSPRRRASNLEAIFSRSLPMLSQASAQFGARTRGLTAGLGALENLAHGNLSEVVARRSQIALDLPTFTAPIDNVVGRVTQATNALASAPTSAMTPNANAAPQTANAMGPIASTMSALTGSIPSNANAGSMTTSATNASDAAFGSNGFDDAAMPGASASNATMARGATSTSSEDLAELDRVTSGAPIEAPIAAARARIEAANRRRAAAAAAAAESEADVDGEQRQSGAQRPSADGQAEVEGIVASGQQTATRTETAARGQAQSRQRRQASRQNARRGRAQRRGASAQRSAASGRQRRRGQAQRRQVDNRARMRETMARYRTQQTERLRTLLEDQRQHVVQETDRVFAMVMAQAQEENRQTLLRIAQEQQQVQQQIDQGKQQAEQMRAQRDAELVRAHADAVRQARDSERQSVQETTRTGTESAQQLRQQGQSEARALRQAASAEAAQIRSQGAAAASAARSRVSGSTPEERRTAQRQANARAQAIAAEARQRAAARIERGNADAQRTIEHFQAQATATLERMRASIEQQHQRTTQAVQQLDANLEQGRQELTAEKDRWCALLDQQLAQYTMRATRELAAVQEYYQAQQQAAERERRERFQAAIRALENQYEQLHAAVEQQVMQRIAAIEQRLATATQADIAAIERDFVTAQGQINAAVATVSQRANQEIGVFEGQTRARMAQIHQRGEATRAAIGELRTMYATEAVNRVNNMSATAMNLRAQRRLDVTQRTVTNLREDLAYDQRSASTQDQAALNAQRQQQLQQRQIREGAVDRSYATSINSADTWSASNAQGAWTVADRYATERHRVLGNEAYTVRRYALTGTEAISNENVTDIRLDLYSNIRGVNNRTAIFSQLGTRTPEELQTLFADTRWRNEFLGELSDTDRDYVQRMMRARTPEEVRALALHWSAEGGTGYGFDQEVARHVFAASTTDAERARLDSTYSQVDAQARNNTGRSLDQMLRHEASYTTTDVDVELFQSWRSGDEQRIAAAETVYAYQGGGYWGAGADTERVLQVRDDLRRRYGGPFRNAAEADAARVAEQNALGRLDATSRSLTQRSLRDLDRSETTAAVSDALDATTRTETVNGRTVFRPDWSAFRSSVAQSGVDDYNTRRIEMAYRDSTPSERRDINARFAATHNGTTFEQYVNANLGREHHVTEDGVEYDTTNSAAGIDRRAAIEMSRDGELRTDTLLVQYQYGHGRGSEQDMTAIGTRLNTLDDAQLAAARTDYSTLVDRLGMRQSEGLQRMREGLDAQQYIGIDPMQRFTAWAGTRIMDSASGPTGDIFRDLRANATARQSRLYGYLLSHGRADTPAERLDQDNYMIAPLGPRPSPGSWGEWSEGYEGRLAREQSDALHRQYRQLQADGTAGLRPEESARLLARQHANHELSDDEYQARMQRLGQFSRTASLSARAQDATVAGQIRTTHMVAQIGGVVVTTVVGVGLTIVSGGTLAPAAIAAISTAAGGLTAIGINYVTLGDNYSRQDFMTDATALIVDTVSAGLLPGAAVNRFAQQMVGRIGLPAGVAREILGSVISEASFGAGVEATKALMDPSTYVGTPEQIRQRILERVRGGALSGGLTAGVNSSGLQLASRAGFNGTTTHTIVGFGAGVIGSTPVAEGELDMGLAGVRFGGFSGSARHIEGVRESARGHGESESTRTTESETTTDVETLPRGANDNEITTPRGANDNDVLPRGANDNEPTPRGANDSETTTRLPRGTNDTEITTPRGANDNEGPARRSDETRRPANDNDPTSATEAPITASRASEPLRHLMSELDAQINHGQRGRSVEDLRLVRREIERAQRTVERLANREIGRELTTEQRNRFIRARLRQVERLVTRALNENDVVVGNGRRTRTNPTRGNRMLADAETAGFRLREVDNPNAREWQVIDPRTNRVVRVIEIRPEVAPRIELTPEQAARNQRQAEEDRSANRQASEDLRNNIESAADRNGNVPGVFENIGIGNGPAGAMNAYMQSLRYGLARLFGGNSAGANGIPRRIAIGRGESPFAKFLGSEATMGQGANEYTGRSWARQPAQFEAGNPRYSTARPIEDATASTWRRSGVPMFEGEVTNVQARPDRLPANWSEPSARFRITVEGPNGTRYFYTNNTDLTVGLGRAGSVRNDQINSNEATAQRYRSTLEGDGRLLNAEQISRVRTDGSVLISGGSATGAWLARLAGAMRGRVTWLSKDFGRSPNTTAARNRYAALERELRMNPAPERATAIQREMAELRAFGPAMLPSNIDTSTSPFRNRNVSRSVGEIRSITPSEQLGLPPGKVVVEFSNGRRGIYDQVVVAHGTESTAPPLAGANGQQMRMRPIVIDEQVVGLESIDTPGLRMMGTNVWNRSNLDLIPNARDRAIFEHALNNQARTAPRDSPGPGLLRNVSRQIELANDPIRPGRVMSEQTAFALVEINHVEEGEEEKEEEPEEAGFELDEPEDEDTTRGGTTGGRNE